MPIPKDILAVARPRNTVVIAYGKNKDRYAVRKRVGCRNVEGRHLPINGPTVGHIVDGRYIPIDDSAPDVVSASPVDIKDWANIALCDRLFKDILGELLVVYNRRDALKLFCIAILRVCNPGIKDGELKEAYEASFLSELYPGVALSKNTVCTFLRDIGKAASRIVRFMQNRAGAISLDHHLIVDGMLKSDESCINSLSDFSRKTSKRGRRDISVLYAFDLEAQEPACSKCFPGNMLDLTAYESFITECGITRGIIVADKGFPASAAAKCFADHPDLHYLNPIKRNSRLIARYHMLDFTGILAGHEGITYKKERCAHSPKWLYSFRDSARAAKEERDWLHRAAKKGVYDAEELRRKQALFGTVVLECDLDLSPEDVYRAYGSRWEIELVFRYYKSACGFDETRVHDDYSVIGSEFCDFLSTVLTFRIIGAFDKARVLERMPYKKAMSALDRAKKVQIEKGEWYLVKVNPYIERLLRDLGLLEEHVPSPKRRRGRPRKAKSVI